MLAYVFWHWRRPEVPPDAYEAAQRAFHRALAAAPPPGFTRSSSAALAGAPWANTGADAYEDWYLVHDSAALDPLNDAAITASRRAAHDAAAALAQGGTAGLYALRAPHALDQPTLVYWFAKPPGMSYAALDAVLVPFAAPGQGALWMRRLVLGPTPEFCLHALQPLTLPWPAVALVLRPIWPARA